MLRKLLFTLSFISFLCAGPNHVLAGEYSRAQWVEISDDKKLFNKECDYKVWVLEGKEWRETWYLEAFDSQNAFYTINRQSSAWNETDHFYALNYKDKTKFLIGENFIDVVPFALCLKNK